MAFSKCPHCANSYFELKEVEPQGSNFKQNFVQCSGCGAPVGVVDFQNTAALLDKQRQQIAIFQSEVSAVANYMRQVLQELQVEPMPSDQRVRSPRVARALLNMRLSLQSPAICRAFSFVSVVLFSSTDAAADFSPQHQWRARSAAKRQALIQCLS